jgi:hypothetical protein
VGGGEKKEKTNKVPFLITKDFIAEECWDPDKQEAFFAARYFDKNEIEIKERIEIGDVIYEPLVNETLKKGLVLLPRNFREGSLKEIFDEAVKLTRKIYYCEESKVNELKLLVLSSLGTWFLDRFETVMIVPGIGGFAPVIAFRGPSGSGKDRFMNALRLVSYRPFYDVATRRIPSLFRPLDQWRGTLCLSEMDFENTGETSELTHFLNCRCTGVPYSRANPKNPRVSDVFYNFGLTMVTQRRVWDDNALEDRTIPFYCERSNDPNLPTEVPKEYVETGRQLQEKLLYLRLMLWDKVIIDPTRRIKGVRDHRLTAAMLVTLALGEHEPSIIEDITEVLKQIERRRREVKAMSIDGMVINAIYDKWSAQPQLIGDYNGLKYVAKEILVEKDENGNEKNRYFIPLQTSDLADTLKLKSSTYARKVLNSLQLHPESSRLPRVIYVWKNSYRPIWIDENRLKTRFAEFVVDYEPPEEEKREGEPPEGTPKEPEEPKPTVYKESVISVRSVRDQPEQPSGEPEAAKPITLITPITLYTHTEEEAREPGGEQPETGGNSSGGSMVVQLQKPAEAGEKHEYVVFRKEKLVVSGSEGQVCKICQKPGATVHLRQGELLYVHDACLAQNPDLRLPSCGREAVLEYLISHNAKIFTSRELKNALARFGISETAVQDAIEKLAFKGLIKKLGSGRYEFKGLNEKNEKESLAPNDANEEAEKKPVVETLSSPVLSKLMRLRSYRPSFPLIQRNKCIVCGKEYEGKFFQLANNSGWDLVSLCPDCFKLWLKHFGGGEG